MSTSMSPTSTSGQTQAGCTPAAPPSRSEIERKLSFRSASAGPPRGMVESPKKAKDDQVNIAHHQRQAPPGNPLSGNDSDSSSITSASQPFMTSPTYPSSPLPTPSGSSTGGLMGMSGRSKMSPPVEIDEAELEDVEEEGDEGEESEEVEKEGGDLQRGMEGERVLKSGYLMKKQERRKAWKRKWFVLRTNKLAYYKDDREYSLKRVLDLKSVQAVAPVTVKKHSFSFGIVTAKRTFLAKASSQDEMDDWVRAINSARRRLSEMEEEARVKRSGSAPSAPVAITPRERPEAIDTHVGTFSSVFTSTAGSFTASPTTAGGYFAPRTPSVAQTSGSPLNTPGLLPPGSPMDTTNSLTGQMAAISLPKSPSMSTSMRMPSTRNMSTASARREASASSIGSSEQFSQHLGLSGLQPSSDEDEPFFNDPQSAFQAPTPSYTNSVSPVDPNKVILSSYLMKRSKGRGRKVWRKRWFYLTSQGLTYTKSHMDSRAVRFVPLSQVLDALEFEPNGSGTDVSDSDLDAPSESSLPRGPSRQFSMRAKEATPASKRAEKPAAGPDEHLFRIVTAKRTFVLCAPSEEDEIKWLAAFRALLTRQRDWSSDTPISPIMDGAPRLSLPQGSVGHNVPYITQQPPTPNSAISPSDEMSTPSVTTSAGPPSLGRPIDSGGATFNGPGSLGGRGRSATYIAKGAVADVVRRYHPEQKDLPATPQHV